MNAADQQQLARTLRTTAEQVEDGTVTGIVLVVEHDNGNESRTQHSEHVGAARGLVVGLSIVTDEIVSAIRSVEAAIRAKQERRVQPASLMDVAKLRGGN